MDKIKYTLHVRLKKNEIFFGNGIYELLCLVDEHKSLNVAGKKMDMSYSKAWRIVKRAESELGFEILCRRIGGAAGGGSEVTDSGREFMQKYAEFREEVNANARILFEKYFGDGMTMKRDAMTEQG